MTEEKTKKRKPKKKERESFHLRGGGGANPSYKKYLSLSLSFFFSFFLGGRKKRKRKRKSFWEEPLLVFFCFFFFFERERERMKKRKKTRRRQKSTKSSSSSFLSFIIHTHTHTRICIHTHPMFSSEDDDDDNDDDDGASVPSSSSSGEGGGAEDETMRAPTPPTKKNRPVLSSPPRPRHGQNQEKVRVTEKRLKETQKTLVRERRQREITEAVLEETTRALDSVRRASIVLASSSSNAGPASSSGNNKFTTVGRTLKLLSSGGKGAEETIEVLLNEIGRLRNELEVTSLKYDEQDAELAATKQQLRAKEAYIKDRRQNVVELKMDIRELTSDEQIEFIDKTREVLRVAVHSSLQIEQLKKMDRKRTQALAKLVEHLQMQRDALQLKLNDLGFKDTSEDDALQEAMIARKFHANEVGKEEPVETPSGKTFYVTRMKSSFYERMFGIHI